MVKIICMKKMVIFLFFFVLTHQSFEQIKWSVGSKQPDQIEWNNYSSSYLNDVSDSVPFLVACIPYNGMNINFGEINTPLDLSFEGSFYRFKSGLFDHALKLYTYDSAEVYFLTPGIYKSNASGFEYRVTLNGKEVIAPWNSITQFDDISIGNFKKGFGFLGGYKTTWRNFIVVELRKKGADTSLCSAIVYWKETKPAIASIYTSKNLNEFFSLLKRPWDRNAKSTISLKDPVFSSNENSIIFYLAQEVDKKEALEYQLVKDGKVLMQWKPNDYDNNFIWLKDLGPGKYILNLRFRKQRHNVSGYNFEIRPAWHQTALFKIIAGGFLAAFFGFVIVLYLLRVQRRKLRRTQLQKERAETELRSLYAQLNPHFIFNSLSSIQGLINTNQIESANHYLTSFSRLLRESLVNSEKEYVPLTTELKTLETYLQLEQLRFHFDYDIEVDEDLFSSPVEIPALLLQPLIENAVKHGLSAKQQKGYLRIRFGKNRNDLVISITDNGTGFDTSSETDGFGLKLTKERVRILNGGEAEHLIAMILNSEKEKGTNIELKFKNWL